VQSSLIRLLDRTKGEDRCQKVIQQNRKILQLRKFPNEEKTTPYSLYNTRFAGYTMGVFAGLMRFLGSSSESETTEIEELILFSLILTGIPVGMAGGVTLSSKVMGLEGSFWKSLIGASISCVAGIAIMVLSSLEVFFPLHPLGGCLWVLGMPISAVIGYHWK